MNRQTPRTDEGMKSNVSRPAVIHDEKTCDLLVAGGGIGGVITAITAARKGWRVILVQDRPVLGGNASSEINVMLAGANAMDFNKDARETGIIEEIMVENAARSPDRSCRLQDDVLWEWIHREPLIELLLNTQVIAVRMAAPDHLEAVETIESGSGRRLLLRARMFADCSGDAVVAHEAGASWRMGREASSEFGESMAPEKADHKVMGCTLPFQFKDTGKPVKFVPPAFARDYSSPDSFPFRHHEGTPQPYWWTEWGGELDPIHQYQEIRDELTRIVYGLWDHLKNHGDHGVENYALLRVGPILGKRESRRVEGPYMLTENDVKSGRVFPDAVAYGGWPIDIHPPEGIDYPGHPAVQIFVDPYEIPLRCLYSKDVKNLFMAGRNISVSHVALGTTRVMSTISTMGQAVGTAAALCLSKGIEPCELAAEDIFDIQQTLLKDDAYLINQRNEDAEDLARHSKATSTSDAPLSMEDGNEWRSLEKGCAQLFALTSEELKTVSLLLKNTLVEGQIVQMKLYRATHLYDFSAGEPLWQSVATVAGHSEGWQVFPFDVALNPGFYWISLSFTPGIFWRRNLGAEPAGTKTAEWFSEDRRWDAFRGHHVVETAEWVPFRGCYTFRLAPPSRPHTAEQVINGVARSVQMPNLWVSDPREPLPQSLTLRFDEPIQPGEIQLTFDTDLDHRVPPRFSPLAVRHYRIWAGKGSEERLIAEECGNYRRRRVHSSDGVAADRIRLEVLSTNGSLSARVFELRIYADNKAANRQGQE